MKILNLYAGIGGNRKLWTPNGDEHEITAVELDPKIAEIYQDFFPKDKMIVTDAHAYLLKHFEEYDFVWSSPPCPSHSRIRKMAVSIQQVKPIYPDMKLYEEILLLQHYFKGKWCVENVISFYPPLIPPQEIAKHYFWTNFFIRTLKLKTRLHHSTIKAKENKLKFDLSSYAGIDKEKTLRNCVEPETGLHVFNEAFKSPVQSLTFA